MLIIINLSPEEYELTKNLQRNVSGFLRVVVQFNLHHVFRLLIMLDIFSERVFLTQINIYLSTYHDPSVDLLIIEMGCQPFYKYGVVCC